jgi:hypothetical protein
MKVMLQPYHIVLAALVGWANERQQQIIKFQSDQIQALLKLLGKKRVLLTDDQQFPAWSTKMRTVGGRSGCGNDRL